MADYDLIPINASAEKLEKLAQMDINSSVIDKESDDNSLPTSKLIFEEFRKNNKNNKEVLNYKLGIWSIGMEYYEGERVIARIYNNDTGLENTTILECIKYHVSPKTNGLVNVVDERFEQHWNVIPIKIDVNQTYNPESENAQSGKAVAEAIQPKIEMWKPDTHYKVGDKVLAIFNTIWYTEFDQTTGTNNINYDLTLICTCKKEHISGNDFTTDLANDFNLWTVTQLNSDEASKASKDAKGNVIHTTYATKNDLTEKMDKFGEATQNETEIIVNTPNKHFHLYIPNDKMGDISAGQINLQAGDGGLNLFSGNSRIDCHNSSLTQVGEPTYDNDAATKGYVDTQMGDIDAALDELHVYAQALINGGATE